jgi:hypothetical protein
MDLPRDFSPRYARLLRSRRVAAPAILAAAALAAAGCGSSGTTASGSGSQAPQQAIVAASHKSQSITSATATLTDQVNGATALTGTVQEQRKPVLLMSMHMQSALGGQQTTLAGVVTANDVYLSIPALTREIGKPWIRVPLSKIGGNSSFAKLFSSLANANPTDETELLAATKHAHVVGQQVVDGVPTTHYAGSFAPGAALATLSPSVRKQLAPALKSVKKDISFNIWIDAQHNIRKMQVNETADSENVVTTIAFTRINQPVHITVPPASQTATLPASALKGTSA